MPARAQPSAAALPGRACPRTLPQLQRVLRAGACRARSLSSLAEVAEAWPGFWDSLLPFLWRTAGAGAAWVARPFLDRPGRLALTQRECLAILANAFFCTFTDRRSRYGRCVGSDRLPSINFDELYGGACHPGVAAAKLRMFLQYFDEMRRREAAGDRLERVLHFTRQAARAGGARDWLACAQPLREPVLKPAGVSLHEAVGALRLDFANRLPGGAVLANGCVQEEILFSICPELVAARLYCPALRANEALLLRGAEQFSTPHGYGLRLEHGGPFRDPAPVDAEGLLQSHFLAVDAGDFRLQPDEAQFTPEAVRRDLDKLWAGLGDGGGPAEVATGNWGCGAFQGDVELKFLIQWAALSRAGRTMLYYPFQEARIVEGAPAVVRALLAARLTVGQLARFLLLQVRPGPVFQQALEQWPPPR